MAKQHYGEKNLGNLTVRHPMLCFGCVMTATYFGWWNGTTLVVLVHGFERRSSLVGPLFHLQYIRPCRIHVHQELPFCNIQKTFCHAIN